MAEVYDRLGRLDRREQLARRAAQPAMPRIEEAPAPGADDGFAEVLEAVGRVVRRWPGVAVMVAQDGRPGQPVIRMSERDGIVEAAVVGHRVVPPPNVIDAEPVDLTPEPLGPPEPAPLAEPATFAVPEPAAVPEPVASAEPVAFAAPEPVAYAEPVASAEPVAYAEPAGLPRAVPEAPRVGTGRMAEALGGASRASRTERAAEPPAARPFRVEREQEQRRPDLRLVPDLPPSGRHASPEPGSDDEDGPQGPSGRVPLPPETSEAVARLAQILRANPSLAATWGRESQEG